MALDDFNPMQPMDGDVWPPPIHSTVSEEIGNTSGHQTTVPPEIDAFKWNWGAFLLSGFWCYKHGFRFWSVGIFLGWLLPFFIGGFGFPNEEYPITIMMLANFCMSNYLGRNGHRLAWRHRYFPDGIDDFFAIQTAWMKWGFAVAILGPPIVLGASTLYVISLPHRF